MSNTVKCGVGGCPGLVTYRTNGQGVAVPDLCPYCVKRNQWKATHLPTPVRERACRICTAPVLQPSGRGQRWYCAACRPLARKLQKRNDYARQLRRAA